LISVENYLPGIVPLLSFFCFLAVVGIICVEPWLSFTDSMMKPLIDIVGKGRFLLSSLLFWLALAPK
jgi:hypothetical protein